jgi:hypothetical protein
MSSEAFLCMERIHKEDKENSAAKSESEGVRAAPARYASGQWELDMHIDGRAKFLSK